MKNITQFLCLFLLCACLFGCCWGNEPGMPAQSSNYAPVTMLRTEFETSVETLQNQTIVNSGKIYVFDDFLFINEVNKGFHVFDYSNAENPVPLCFINTPGATDVSIKNGMLYINQAVDLITLKYNSDTKIFDVLYRNTNVFPQKISPDGFEFYDINANEIIVGFNLNSTK